MPSPPSRDLATGKATPNVHADSRWADSRWADSRWIRLKSLLLPRLAVMREQMRLLAGSGVFVRLLAALLAVDAVLILLHILHELHDMRVIGGGAFLESRLLLVGEDLGFGEMFGYAKSLVIAAMLLACYRRAREPIFAALGFTFVVIVLDDGLQLHEAFGHRIAMALAPEPVFGLRPQDLGELIVWSALGAVVVPALAAGFWRSGSESQTLAAIFLGLLGALVFFAVVVDMLATMLRSGFRGAHRVWPVIEDGGEMVTLSLTCAAAVAAASRIRALTRPTTFMPSTYRS